MSQLVAQPVSGVPSLPIESMTPEMVSSFNALFGDMSAGFSTTIRRIKIRKSDIQIVEGQTETNVPSLPVVVLGVAPCNHAVWYAREYAQGQEATAPDLVWLRHTEATFPDALPAEFRQKIKRNGTEMWAFQTRRRVVVAPVMFDQAGNVVSIDVDNPCVADLSGMSLYGKSNPKGNEYKWSGLIDLCKKYSRGQVMVSPAHFVTQIVPDPNATVTGVCVFRPLLSPDGYLRFLDGNQIQQVFTAATSSTVKDMLIIREVLTYDGAQSAQSVATVPPIQQQASNVQPQPMPQPTVQPVQPTIQNVQPTVQSTVQQTVQPVQSVQAEDPMSLLQQASQVLGTAAPAAAPAGTPVADPVQAALDNLRTELG